jgi:hypothetical protein
VSNGGVDAKLRFEAGTPGRPFTPGRSAADTRRIAIHEAAHAVIGRVLGESIGGATIVPGLGDESDGRVWGAFPVRESPVDRVTGYLAGTEAERLLCDGAHWLFSGDDEAKAELEAKAFCRSNDTRDFISCCRSRARALIDCYRSAVLAVAECLVEKGTISGQEIDVIAARALAIDTFPGGESQLTVAQSREQAPSRDHPTGIDGLPIWPRRPRYPRRRRLGQL